MRDGGPAFPTDERQYDKFSNQFETVRGSGMSLLDYFAREAMGELLEFQGECMDRLGKALGEYIKDGGATPDLPAFFAGVRPREVARLAYEYADAMLAERERWMNEGKS